MNTPAGGVTLPELLPCPFCGSAAFATAAPGEASELNAVNCTNKQCSASAYFIERATWNTRAALAGEWRVPKGFVLVPVEATEEMKQAAYAQQAEYMRQLGEHCEGAPEPEDLFVLMWRAAISAAPLPKEPGGGWRPIAEAPTDGRWLLVFCKGAGCPAVVRWDEEVGAWMDACGHSFAYPVHWQKLPTYAAAKGEGR